MMEHFGISTPVVEFITLVLTSQRSILESYIWGILSAWGFNNTFDVLLSLILQPVMGFERLSHYQENYGMVNSSRSMMKLSRSVEFKNFKNCFIGSGIRCWRGNSPYFKHGLCVIVRRPCS